MPLTGRGWVVLVAAAVTYPVGVWAGYPVFRVLAGMALGAVLAAIALTVRRQRVEVDRELYPARVEKGKPALATLRVRNTSERWQPGFWAHDLAGDVHEAVQVRRLAPGAEATYRYEVSTARRGRITVGPLVLEFSDPLSLARRRVDAGGSTVLLVQPKRHPARTVVGGRPRHHHEIRTTDNSLRGSMDLRDIRPYVIGDEVRHVHWKATARLGQLMVRDFVDPDQPCINVLLDTRTDVLSATGFEEAVEVATSVAVSAIMAGHHCRLLSPNGLDLVSVGPAAAGTVLDTLTDVTQVGQSGRDSQNGPSPSDVPRPHQMSLLPTSMVSGSADNATLMVVTGPHLTARELASVAARHRSVTVVAIGTPNSASNPTGVPSQRVRWIVETRAAAAVRQWNLEA